MGRQIDEDDVIREISKIHNIDVRYVRAVMNAPTAQPEEAIPVSWIEERIARFMMEGDAFSGLTASIIRVMLNEWKREQEGATT